METKAAGAETQAPGEERVSTLLGISQVKKAADSGRQKQYVEPDLTFRSDLWSLEAATEFRGHLQWD